MYTTELLDAAVEKLCQYVKVATRVAYGSPNTGNNIGVTMYSTMRSLPGHALDAATGLGRSEISIAVSPSGKYRVLSTRASYGVVVLYAGVDKEKAVSAFNTNEVVPC